MLGALCLATGSLHVTLPVTRFTLRWQHAIEKIEWAEDYAVVGPWLHLSEARIRGSGAGMEPPEGARLRDGIWHYRLADLWRHKVALAHSEFAPDYELCLDGRCRRLTHWLPIAAESTTRRACAAGGGVQR